MMDTFWIWLVAVAIIFISGYCAGRWSVENELTGLKLPKIPKTTTKNIPVLYFKPSQEGTDDA